MASIVGVLILGIAWMVFTTKQRLQPRPPPNIDLELRRLTQEGLVAERSGNYQLALQRYQSALQRKPSRLELKISVGRMLASLGQYDEAWPYYQDAAKGWTRGFDGPGASPDSVAWYADFASTHGEPDQVALLAGHDPRGGLDRNRNIARAHLLAAASGRSAALNDWVHIRRAIALDPNWILGRLAQIHLARETNKPAEAEAGLRIARTILPKGGADAWAQMGRFDTEYGNAATATAEFRQAKTRLKGGLVGPWVDYLRSVQRFNLVHPREAIPVSPETAEEIARVADLEILYQAKQAADLIYQTGNPNVARRLYTKIAEKTKDVGPDWVEQQMRMAAAAKPTVATTVPSGTTSHGFKAWLSTELGVVQGAILGHVG